MKKNSELTRPYDESRNEETLEEDISIHIFSTSATMVGVCLTVIGIFKLIFQLKAIGTLGDDLLAIDASLFLIACILSYWALRTRVSKRRRITEKLADIVFLVALTAMTFTCALITYAFV
jgi:hypothetical protein